MQALCTAILYLQYNISLILVLCPDASGLLIRQHHFPARLFSSVVCNMVHTHFGSPTQPVASTSYLPSPPNSPVRNGTVSLEDAGKPIKRPLENGYVPPAKRVVLRTEESADEGSDGEHRLAPQLLSNGHGKAQHAQVAQKKKIARLEKAQALLSQRQQLPIWQGTPT